MNTPTQSNTEAVAQSDTASSVPGRLSGHIAHPATGAQAGDLLHRAYVGPRDEFDVGAAHQFNLLTSVLGLREYHHLLELGCGALRAGRLFIPYLQAGHYCGIEPNRWLVEAGLDRELGRELARLREPRFSHTEDFDLQSFGQSFDFILAQSIFSHTSQRQLKKCLSEVALVLKPSGLFAASYHVSDEDYEGDAWVYPESVAYRPETIQSHAEQAGLRCHPIAWGNQNQQSWVLFYHPEREGLLPGLSELKALQIELSVVQRRLETIQRGGISPADHARVIERLKALESHPAVLAAMQTDPSLKVLIHSGEVQP